MSWCSARVEKRKKQIKRVTADCLRICRSSLTQELGIFARLLFSKAHSAAPVAGRRTQGRTAAACCCLSVLLSKVRWPDEPISCWRSLSTSFIFSTESQLVLISLLITFPPLLFGYVKTDSCCRYLKQVFPATAYIAVIIITTEWLSHLLLSHWEFRIIIIACELKCRSPFSPQPFNIIPNDSHLPRYLTWKYSALAEFIQPVTLWRLNLHLVSFAD